MDARHHFTTDAPTFPLHAVEPEASHADPDAPWYVRFSFDRFEREWNDTAEQYAAKDAFFAAATEAKRDQDKAAEWGCTIAELPWNARAAAEAWRLREGEKRCGE